MPRSGSQAQAIFSTSLYSDPGIAWKLTRSLGCCGGEADYADSLNPNGCIVRLDSPFDGDGDGYSGYNLVSLPVNDGASYTLYVYKLQSDGGCCGTSWQVYTATISCGYSANPIIAWVPRRAGLVVPINEGMANPGLQPPLNTAYLLTNDFQFVGEGAFPNDGSGNTTGSVTVAGITVYDGTHGPLFDVSAGPVGGGGGATAGLGRFDVRGNHAGQGREYGIHVVDVPAAPTIGAVTTTSIQLTIPAHPTDWDDIIAGLEEPGVSGWTSVDLYRNGVLRASGVIGGQVINDTGLSPGTFYIYKLVYHTAFNGTPMNDVDSYEVNQSTANAGPLYQDFGETGFLGAGTMAGDAGEVQNMGAAMTGEGSLAGAGAETGFEDMSGALSAEGSLSGAMTTEVPVVAEDMSATMTGEGTALADMDVERTTACCPVGEWFNPSTQMCEAIPPGFGQPDAPAAPTATKTCEPLSILVTAPAWPVAPAILATSQKLQRSKGNGTNWQDVHTWNAAGGTYDDTDVSPFESIIYRAANCNDVGCSQCGPPSAAIVLQSDTMTVTLLSPDEGAVLSGNQLVQVQLADTAEVLNDCDLVISNGPCAQEDPEVTVYLDDNELPLVFTRVAGSPRNGLYEAPWDTYNHANGVGRRVKG